MSGAVDREVTGAAWPFAPVAAPAWRPRAPRARARRWAWWAAALLHAALMAAILLDLGPRDLSEPIVLEATPLVWEGPVGAGEGAETLSPQLTAPPPAPETAASAPAEPPPPPLAELPPTAAPPAAAPAAPEPAPAEAAAPPAPAPPATPEAPPSSAPAPAPPVPSPPAPQPAQPAPPRPAEPLPLPLPPAPAPPPRPAPPAAAAPASAPPASPATAGAPMRSVEVPVAPGAIRLGAGATGAPGESRAVGAPQPGCQDVIGYPPDERRRGITGAVVFRLRISDDGRVVEARLVEPSGSFALDEAAQRGIRRCRFVPALRDGVPVWGSRDYRVVFNLN